MQDYRRALKFSYLLLKYRARSRHELIYRLKKKGYSLPLIKKVISHLEEYSYIDDRQFARQFALTYRQKGWGQRKISFALKRLGVAKDLVEHSLGEKEDYRKIIRETIEKRVNHYKEPNKYQKVLKYLISKGFDYQDILSELEEFGIERFK